MLRRLLIAVFLSSLLAVSVGAYWQSQASDKASQPGWNVDTSLPEKAVATPLLSVRRVPNWLVAPSSKARLANAFNVALEQHPDIQSKTCLVAYRDNDLVVEHLADEPLVPASLMKIVTAVTFLEAVGGDFRYTTSVVVQRDDLESVKNGILNGDIYLVGGGDPVLSTPDYIERYPESRVYTDITKLAEEVAEYLRENGITTIRGRVVADESRYPEAERDYAAHRLGNGDEDLEEDIWRTSLVAGNQVGPLAALILNDGYTSYPSDPSYSARTQNVRATDPARSAAVFFDDLLEARDFVITRSPITGIAPVGDERVLLGDIQSPPASEIVARMLHYSDNTTAELLFKEAGRQIGIQNGIVEIGSARSEAAYFVRGVATELIDLPTELLNEEALRIVDGSGLSSYNRLTCRIVAELLRSAGVGSMLVDALPVVGRSGTLSDCEVDGSTVDTVSSRTDDDTNNATELELNEMWVKTGTLNDVSALAGMTVADTQELVVFVVVVNGDGIITVLQSCNVLQKAVMAAALGYPYGPLTDNEMLHPKSIEVR